MNAKIVLLTLGLSVLLLAGCTQGNTTGNNTLPADNNPVTAALSATVTITDSGYDPQTVTIKKGGTVTWVSATDREDWPATAMHPTHERYPGSSIAKCGTPDEPTIFDACQNLQNGDSYSFTFNEAGEWPYHDHVVAKTFGKIIVVE